MWRWSNWLHSLCSADKLPLRINLDETSVKIYPNPSAGNLTAEGRQQKRTHEGLRRQINKSHFRSAYTCVAMICDDSTIQQQLPQIIILNKKTCSTTMFASLKTCLRDNVLLWRRKSSWLKVSGTCEILRLLGKRLAPFLKTRQPIISMDAAKTHLNEKVWETAAKNGFLMHVVPAKVTYCMQPLDVYAFALLKGRCKMILERDTVEGRVAEVTLLHSVKSLNQAIVDVLCSRSWGHSFSHLGLAGDQQNLSKKLLGKMGLENTNALELNTFPSLVDLQCCWPRGSIIPLDAVFKGAEFVSGARPLPKARAVRLGTLRMQLRVCLTPAGGTSSSSVKCSASSSSAAAATQPAYPVPRLLRLPSRRTSLQPPPPVPPPPLPPPVLERPRQPPPTRSFRTRSQTSIG